MITSAAQTAPPDTIYDREVILSNLLDSAAAMGGTADEQSRRVRGCHDLIAALDTCEGRTLQQRWIAFEQTIWPRWKSGRDRPSANRWTTGVRIAVMNRHVVPSWSWFEDARLRQWAGQLNRATPLSRELRRLDAALEGVHWVSKLSKEWAISTALRLMLTRSYDRLEQITDEDLKALPRDRSKGTDVLDAALCALGVFKRTLLRGASRRNRRPRRPIEELVAESDIPQRFRAITILYLQTYATRVSDTYATLRHKLIALGHFWRFMHERYPQVQTVSAIRPTHARAFIPYAIERANNVRRGPSTDEHMRTTAHA